MKEQRQTELPRFVVGALATAGASMVNAATVQITFTNSFISSIYGNMLDDDYGDDGGADMVGNAASPSFRGGALASLRAGIGSGLNSVLRGIAVRYVTNISYRDRQVAAAGVSNTVIRFGAEDAVVRNLAELYFSDSNIRGGEVMIGYLDITAVSNFEGEQRVTVHRLIFDDDTGGAISGLNVTDPAFSEFAAIPEPSSLGLLALGAGGLLARRRREKAAA
jgi:hypothetical protein